MVRKPSKRKIRTHDALLTRKQAAKAIGVSEQIIQSCINHGLVPTYLDARGRRRVRLEDFLHPDFESALQNLMREQEERRQRSELLSTFESHTRASVEYQEGTDPLNVNDATPSTFVPRDPDRLFAAAIVERLNEIDRMTQKDDATLREWVHLRTELRERSPEMFDAYKQSTKP